MLFSSSRCGPRLSAEEIAGYDADGNITSVATMSRSFTYDAENRIATATTGSPTAIYGSGAAWKRGRVIDQARSRTPSPSTQGFRPQGFSAANRAYRSTVTRLDQGARTAAIGIGTGISNAF